MAELLRVDQLSAGYGAASVLEDIHFSLSEGDSLALLGRNGVGKSTLLLSLMGLCTQHGGRIDWRGTRFDHLPTFARAQCGVGWVPQERQLFASLTVEEHLTVVARPGEWTVEKIYRLFPRLQERRRNRGKQLSGGEQQMLAIARALMTNPTLLLLDEPMEGLAPLIIEELVQVLRSLVGQTSMAFILVEQHARLALTLTDRALVLDRGAMTYLGESGSLLDDPARLDALLVVGAQ